MVLPAYFLTFDSQLGLDGPSFNTLRLGQSWAKKLAKGDEVLLAKGVQVIGLARVEEVIVGPREKVIEGHIHANHVELALAAQQGEGYDGGTAVQRAVMAMTRLYGPARFTEAKYATAIYLTRIE